MIIKKIEKEQTKMVDAVKLLITNSCGMCPVGYGYYDVITLTPNSIGYHYYPEKKEVIIEGEEQRKDVVWSHKDDSQSFSEEYRKIVSLVEEEMDKINTDMVMDIGCITLSLTYGDGNEVKKGYLVFPSKFYHIFKEIKKIVPAGVMIPILLKDVSGD